MNATLESSTVEVMEIPSAVPTTALAPTTPAALLELAVRSGASMGTLERMMALQERWEANEARKAFTLAMTEFKREPLDIFKRKQVSFTTRDGDTTSYKHAELADVADVVVPALARHGLSHRWDVKQADGRITVTCTVTHKAGHSESVTMDAAPDSSGKKNAIQQVASAITYMQRYTLLAITGLATKDDSDDDGRGAGSEPGANALAEKWSTKARAAKTEAELSALWVEAVAEINVARDQVAKDALRGAIVQRRSELAKEQQAKEAQS